MSATGMTPDPPSETVQALTSIVGPTGIISYPDIEPRQRQQLAQAVHPDTQFEGIVYPETQAALSEVVRCAHRHQWRLLPCGQGTKLSWGGLTQGINLVVSTERLNHLIDHAAGDLTVTVEAGMPFAQLQAMLAKTDQFLALDPAYRHQATIGGIVATADAGSLRQRYGGVRDMCLGVAFARADGELVKAGGRVVKNVAGYDLMKLLTGSFGTLGILSEVTLRLYPLPPASRSVLLAGSDALIAKATATLLKSTLTPTAIDLLSGRLLSNFDARFEVAGSVGLIAQFQSLPESVEQQATQLLKLAETLGLQATLLSETEEPVWGQIQDLIWQGASESQVICKLGVLPAEAVAILTQLEAAVQGQVGCTGLIHAGSGLGIVRLQGDPKDLSQAVLAVRSLCEQASPGGFLSILEAPVTLKQQLDVWGYRGNALGLMQTLKQQFDPHQLLSPQRFIGGI